MKKFSGENGTVSLRLYLPFTCIRNKSSGYTKTFQVADIFEIVLKTILCKQQIRSLPKSLQNAHVLAPNPFPVQAFKDFGSFILQRRVQKQFCFIVSSGRTINCHLYQFGTFSYKHDDNESVSETLVTGSFKNVFM